MWEIRRTEDEDGEPILTDPRGTPGDMFITISVDGERTAHTLVNKPFTRDRVETAIKAAIVSSRRGGNRPEEFMETLNKELRYF